MAIDPRLGGGDAADAALERALLDSAKIDAVSEAATREAWERFSRATGVVALVAGGTAVLRARHGLVPKLSHGVAFKWLVVGAIGGSALTALWTRGVSNADRASQSSTESARTSERFVPRNTIAVPSARELHDPVSKASAAPSGFEDTSVAAAALSKEALHSSPRHAFAGAQRRPSRPDSTLPAEVRALDAVRSAIANGAFREATRLVDEYHRDFAHGQLTADADVLAIESLEAMGDHADAARRATEFLRRYPKDPHAGRIAAIADE